MPSRRSFITHLALASFASSALAQSSVAGAQAPSGVPTLHLTVDDGWFDQEAILHSFVQAKAVGTFYIAGQALEEYAGHWRAALEKGMVMGCHSHAHKMAHRLNEQAFRDDLARYEKAATRVFGSQWRDHVPTFRFPFGDMGGRNRKLFAHILSEEYGWSHVGWDLDLSFSHGKGRIRHFRDIATPMAIFEREHTPGSIVLTHFAHNDARVLAEILEKYAGRFSFEGVHIAPEAVRHPEVLPQHLLRLDSSGVIHTPK